MKIALFFFLCFSPWLSPILIVQELSANPAHQRNENGAKTTENSQSNSIPQLIENPSTPSSKNAGRVVELKPVLEIKDQPGHFFFRYPSVIKLSRSGEVFVLDREQILHFDSSGQFLRNYFRKGQGPGDLQHTNHIIIDDCNLVAFDVFSRKICRFDFSGNLVAEIKINVLQIGNFLVYIDGNKYYFVRKGFPFTKSKSIRVDNPNYLQVYDAKENRLEELAA